MSIVLVVGGFCNETMPVMQCTTFQRKWCLHFVKELLASYRSLQAFHVIPWRSSRGQFVNKVKSPRLCSANCTPGIERINQMIWYNVSQQEKEKKRKFSNGHRSVIVCFCDMSSVVKNAQPFFPFSRFSSASFSNSLLTDHSLDVLCNNTSHAAMKLTK